MFVLPEKPSTILLADADPGSTPHLRAVLESWNYQVEVIADGSSRLQAPHRPSVPRPGHRGLRIALHEGL